MTQPVFYAEQNKEQYDIFVTYDDGDERFLLNTTESEQEANEYINYLRFKMGIQNAADQVIQPMTREAVENILNREDADYQIVRFNQDTKLWEVLLENQVLESFEKHADAINYYDNIQLAIEFGIMNGILLSKENPELANELLKLREDLALLDSNELEAWELSQENVKTFEEVCNILGLDVKTLDAILEQYDEEDTSDLDIDFNDLDFI